MNKRTFKMSSISLLVAAVAAITVSACSSIGDTVDKINPFASSAPKVKPAELVSFQPTINIKPQWQASVGSGGEFTFSPAIVGDVVYAAAKNGTVARIESGREVWRVNVGQPLSGGVGADRGLVAVGTAKGDVLALNSNDGSVAWKAKVSSEVLAAPAVGEGLVVVRSGDSRVFAFEQADGKRRWVYQRSTPALSVRSNVGVLLAGRGIVAGFPGGKLVAISTNNGAALWEVTVALPKGATELERVADITSSPVMDGRQVCAVAFQGRVTCIDLSSGNTIWSRELSSTAGLDIDARAVYVSDDKGSVHAFDRFTGSSMWKQSALANRHLSRPIALGSHVAVGDGQGVLHVLRRDDGAFAARVNTDGSAISAEPQHADTGFVIQTRNGAVSSFTLE